jgi:hypothetical protein
MTARPAVSPRIVLALAVGLPPSVVLWWVIWRAVVYVWRWL